MPATTWHASTSSWRNAARSLHGAQCVGSHAMKAHLSVGLLFAASLLCLSPASAQDKVLRIAMTASDIPTTTGMPNNAFEGIRFLRFPIFEGLILFDLTKSDQLATLRPGLAATWELTAALTN